MEPLIGVESFVIPVIEKYWKKLNEDTWQTYYVHHFVMITALIKMTYL